MTEQFSGEKSEQMESKESFVELRERFKQVKEKWDDLIKWLAEKTKDPNENETTKMKIDHYLLSGDIATMQTENYIKELDKLFQADETSSPDVELLAEALKEFERSYVPGMIQATDHILYVGKGPEEQINALAESAHLDIFIPEKDKTYDKTTQSMRGLSTTDDVGKKGQIAWVAARGFRDKQGHLVKNADVILYSER